MIYRHHVLETEMKSILCAKKKKRLQSLVGHTGFYFFSNIKKFTLIEINFVLFFFIFLICYSYSSGGNFPSDPQRVTAAM